MYQVTVQSYFDNQTNRMVYTCKAVVNGKTHVGISDVKSHAMLRLRVSIKSAN